MCNTEPSLPDTPWSTSITDPPAELPELSKRCHQHRKAQRTLPPLPWRRLLEERLGQKKGCE